MRNVRAGEHERSPPVVTLVQGGEHTQREHSVLVLVVGAEAEQEARLCLRGGLIAGSAVWRPRIQCGRHARLLIGTVIQTGRHHPDPLGVDKHVGEQLAARVLGEDDDSLRREHAVAARAPVILPCAGVGEVAGVAVGDQVQLAEHDPLPEPPREGDIAG